MNPGSIQSAVDGDLTLSDLRTIVLLKTLLAVKWPSFGRDCSELFLEQSGPSPQGHPED